jgi:hypothetical protein
MTDIGVSPPASPPAAPPVPPPAPNASEVLNAPPPPPPFWESFADANLKLAAEKSGLKNSEEAFARAHKFDAFKEVDPAAIAALPKADDPNAFVAFAREKLGAPTDAAAYALDKIEGVDKDLAGAAQAWFQEAGLTPFQAQHIAAKQMEHMKAAAEAGAKEDAAEAARELTQLKTEWKGEEFESKRLLGERALRAAAKHAGVDAKEVIDYISQGAGVAGAIKMAAFFGSLMREGDFVDGERSTQPKSLLERLYPNEVAEARNR